jgi:hypothetical protein
MTSDAIRKRKARKNLTHKLSPAELVTQDISNTRATKEYSVTKKKYKLLIAENEELQALVDVVKQTADISTYTLSKKDIGRGQATAICLASDWHSEEHVDPETVNGLNEFNLDVSDARIDAFFQNVVRLLEAKKKSIAIETLVLYLLGDFISGSIHDELAESNLLPPADALIRVQNKIASGIEYILAHTDVTIIAPCHSGNHARMTKEHRFSTEKGNSLEYIMYHNLANYFRGEKRVKFLISGGYLAYLDIAGFTIRSHHGHQCKFSGGVGGLYIPAFKKIAQFNKGRWADLDVFAHFHQLVHAGSFVCNGSIIGPSAYSLGFGFERPKQAFFLVNHERKEVTDFCPVWVD